MRKPGTAFITGDKDRADKLPGKACQSTGTIGVCAGAQAEATLPMLLATYSDGDAVETPGDQRAAPGIHEVWTFTSVLPYCCSGRLLPTQQEGAGFAFMSFKWELKT